jgi:hypothetical protein
MLLVRFLIISRHWPQALWYSAALECINTVYALADHPDRVGEEMTKRLYDGLCAAIAYVKSVYHTLLGQNLL